VKWLGYLERGERMATFIANAISIFIVLFMILLVSVYIILREFNVIILFVEEWSGYLVVLMGYLSLTYAFKQDAHIQVDIVLKKIPTKAKPILDVVTSFITLALVVWISLQSSLFAVEAMKTGQTSLYVTHTPLWIPRMFVPVGFSLFSVALALATIRKLEALIKSYRIKNA
jgi:TRAP-type C4-dicarboxylate transport system permease small subunit